MLGLVSDTIHRKEHRDRAAKRGEEKKSAFSRAFFRPVLCSPFIVDRNGYADHRDNKQINEHEKQDYLIIEKLLHITSWGKSP